MFIQIVYFSRMSNAHSSIGEAYIIVSPVLHDAHSHQALLTQRDLLAALVIADKRCLDYSRE